MQFSRFFIDRPIFAAVLSIVIFLAGGIAMFALPISEYPEVVPPSVVVRAVFSNRSRVLTPGLFARVKLVGTEKTKSTLVRDAAIGTDQDRKFVLVVGPGDTLVYRPIEPGRLTDGLRIVSSGLKPGERIVVNGLMRVRPGMKVTPTLAPMVPDSATAAAER